MEKIDNHLLKALDFTYSQEYPNNYRILDYDPQSDNASLYFQLIQRLPWQIVIEETSNNFVYTEMTFTNSPEDSSFYLVGSLANQKEY